MIDTESSTLKTTLAWIFGLLALVLVLELGYWVSITYLFKTATDEFVGDIQKATEQSNARAEDYQLQREQEEEAKRRQQFNQDTMCALNNDTEMCVCLHRKTGQVINLSHAECIKRATKATDQLK